MFDHQDPDQAMAKNPCFTKIKKLYDYLDQQHGNAGVARFALFSEHVREAGTTCLLSGVLPSAENLKEFLNVYLHHANAFGNLETLQQLLDMKIASIPLEFKQFKGYEPSPINMTERHLDLLFNLLDEASCLGHMHCVEHLIGRFPQVKIPELKSLAKSFFDRRQEGQLQKFSDAKNQNGELYKRVLHKMLNSPLADQASLEWVVKKYLVCSDTQARTSGLLHMIKHTNSSKPRMATILSAAVEKVLAEVKSNPERRGHSPGKNP